VFLFFLQKNEANVLFLLLFLAALLKGKGGLKEAGVNGSMGNG
jgi:hypothetical protein